MHRRVCSLVLVFLVLALPGIVTSRPAHATSTEPAFARLWTRTDQPVAREQLRRTWFWGPSPLTEPIHERYLDARGQQRLVQYFDKGRMEIINPAADPNSPWYVTSGLLTRELISGRIQIGTATFLRGPGGAAIPVAGDPSTPFPTYRDLAAVIDQPQPDRTGQHATTVLRPEGTSVRDDVAADPKTRFVEHVTYLGPTGTQVGYNVPLAFWEFMNQPGMIEVDGQLQQADPLFDWLFVLGYPIADPFWVLAPVGGVDQWILVQPFERRVLTYTPSNPTGWQVEMGNIGQHYYAWRYALTPPTPLSGDVASFALRPDTTAIYRTTYGMDTRWQISGTTTGFSGGSTLITREEYGWNGRYQTHWGVTPSGLDLYGRDRIDDARQVLDTVVYWPPIRYLPGLPLAAGTEWQTHTTALSLREPARSLTVTGRVLNQELVATPAGFFPAWKIQFEETSDTPAPSGSDFSATIWFTPGIGVIQWHQGSVAAQLAAASTLIPDH